VSDWLIGNFDGKQNRISMFVEFLGICFVDRKFWRERKENFEIFWSLRKSL